MATLERSTWSRDPLSTNHSSPGEELGEAAQHQAPLPAELLREVAREEEAEHPGGLVQTH